MQPNQPSQTPLKQQPVAEATQSFTQPGYENTTTQVSNPVANIPTNTGTNGLAIAGLIMAWLVAPIGLILSIIALRQIKSTGQGGRKLAIAGIVLSSIILAIFAVLFSLTIKNVSNAKKGFSSVNSQSSSADVAKSQAVPVADEYMAAIIAKDGAAAYELETPDAQLKYTSGLLTNGFTSYHISGDRTSNSVTAIVNPNGVATDVKVVNGYGNSRPKYIAISLKKINDIWLVSEFSGTDSSPSN